MLPSRGAARPPRLWFVRPASARSDKVSMSEPSVNQWLRPGAALASAMHQSMTMNRILVHRRSQPWWMYGLILSAVLLTLGVGLCLFDGGDHGSGGGHLLSPDLCLGVLASVSVAPLVARLPLSGWAVTDRLASIPMSTLHVPAPPPKSL